MRERNSLSPEMYGAASIGERQQEKLQYTCIAGFMRLNFPSEWLIKTVYGDPSSHTSDQVVFFVNTFTKIKSLDSTSHFGSYFAQSSFKSHQFISCSQTSRCLICSHIIKVHRRSLTKIFTLDMLEKIFKHFLPLCWSNLKRACKVRFLMMLAFIQRRKAL